MAAVKLWFKDIIYGNKITLILRVVLGAIFIFSSIGKIINPDLFDEVVRRYDILVDDLVPYVVIIIPYLEFFIGILLVIGYKIKASAALSIVLMISFLFFISVNVIRGEYFDCGCIDFKQYGIFFEERIGFGLLIRDTVYLLFGIVIYKAERHLFSIQSLKIQLALRKIS